MGTLWGWDILTSDEDTGGLNKQMCTKTFTILIQAVIQMWKKYYVTRNRFVFIVILTS